MTINFMSVDGRDIGIPIADIIMHVSEWNIFSERYFITYSGGDLISSLITMLKVFEG